MKKSATKNLPQLRRRVFFLAVAVVAAWLLFKLSLFVLPFPQLTAFRERPCSPRLYDRNGELVQVPSLGDGLRREWYDLEELPPRILEVFVAAEDERFYKHGGIDLRAALRAAVQNFSEGRTVSGASTITMQLARLVVPRQPGAEVTLAVKLWEAWNALRLEAKLGKDEILELYLNSLPFGLQAEGIGSAARTYFGLTPAELSEAQIHALAVIPRRPARYNLLEDPAASFEAALEIGMRTGFSATLEQWLAAVSVPRRYTYPMRLPHFVRHVQEQYRLADKAMPSQLSLSVSAALTEATESQVNTQLELHRDARLSHGAVVAIDHLTGEILCWSGGNFESDYGGQIDGVTVRNQSGSTMKPFIYALALERGFSPSDVLADVPMDFGGEEVYVPLNFNNQYNGPILMRTALASSLNIPAVYLLYRLGVDNYMALLADLGFESLAGERERTGLSLALGSGEVTLLELARAFSVFARGGSIPDLRLEVAEPTDGGGEGDTAESMPTAGKAVFKEDTTAIVCDFLSDRRARSLGFGFAQVFNTPYPAIFKTGTSNQFQNIVALGSTSRYTAAVWMGNHTGETVIQETGSSIPAVVVRAVLDYLTESGAAAPQSFPPPKNYRKVAVCSLSGKTPTAACPATTEEFVAVAAQNNREFCDWHYSTGGGTVAVNYPQEYQRWLSGRNEGGGLLSESPLSILYPTDGAQFVYDASIPAAAQKIRVDCTGSGTTAELYVNGQFFQASGQPFLWFVPLQPGVMNLTVRLPETGEQTSVTVRVQ